MTGGDLRVMRKQAAVNQSELATACGLSVKTIMEIEHGKLVPRTPTIDAIGKKLAEIVEERNSPGPQCAQCAAESAVDAPTRETI